jgi:FKBP-type peptidyl-prolyl cis-trans isomerase
MKKLLFVALILMFYTNSMLGQSKKIWEETQSLNTIPAYKEFVQKYPDGKYSETAKQRIADMEKHEAEQALELETRINEVNAADEKIVPGVSIEDVISLLKMDNILNRNAFGGMYVEIGVFPENANSKSTFTGTASIDGYDIVCDNGKVVSKQKDIAQIGTGRVNFSTNPGASGSISEEERAKKLAEEKARTEMKNEARKSQEPLLLANYLNEKNITVSPAESGLIYIETVAGQGPKATKGQNVVVHYSATLLDGSKFDSSYDRNQPLAFTLGVGQVIKGWDEGIAMMNIGGKATLIIPSALAYGERDLGIIPPYSTLVFDVELIDVQ